MTRKTATLLVTASAIALGTHSAQAAEVIFSNAGQAQVEIGERVTQASGLTQIKLDNGAMLSFVDGAEYQINADGSVELFSGSVTVSGAPNGTATISMPDGAQGFVSGADSSASFTVADNGDSAGHAITGTSRVMRGRSEREFRAGEFWESSGRRGLRQVVANTAPAPTPQDAGERERQVEVADLSEGGPVAAAQNGLPVSLGDALAAAGASSDILGAARSVDLAAGNPSLDTFPTGDLALLVAAAADLEGLNGGTPFPAAQADIIRTYLGFLADGGSGASFLTTYAGFLTQYLDLIRDGGLPSDFGAASITDINAFLAFSGRTGAFNDLAAADQVLADRYLAFLASGGDVDGFATTFTGLVNAYFTFVRGGGDPDNFAGASQSLLNDYIAFLAASGLQQQLSAADQTLLAAFNANGGLGFAREFEEALNAYFAFLQSGNLPSEFAATDPDLLQAYLEQLQASGLFQAFLGEQADFYAEYLAFVQGGGDPDAFARLNANIFAGFATDLNAYFAFLQNGDLPSDFTATDLATLQAYLEQLQTAGLLNRFLGNQAGFYADYLTFVQAGGDPDAFAGLNANLFAGFATDLDAYYTYLLNGGQPSAYQPLTQTQIASYIAALQAQGVTGRFLDDLAGFYTDYAAFLASGGNPDVFTGLPVLNFPAFASALNAYAAFLNNGGLPADFTATDLDVLANYVSALQTAGETDNLLGANADLLTAYFAFIEQGGAIDLFPNLPLYVGYATDLQAYFTFLANGGLPNDFTGLSEAQVADYLAALNAAGGFQLQIGGDAAAFFADYFAFIGAGNDPQNFAQLPIYGDYVTQLNAYFDFLAGGGLPADFSGLSQQIITQYLAALNGVSGGLDAFDDLDMFADNYAAFILGGGDPARFAGLPVYASYVTQLNAYFAFLAGGGLPGDFTGLNQATIDAYLAALANVTGGLDAFAGLNGNFDSYITFLLNGGDPATFAGLPVYSGYVTQLNAYFAFLAGGGLPAEYTALDQATIEAYLAALTNVTGGLDSFNGLNSFFAAYSQFVLGGGDAEDFAGLPVYAEYLTAISQFYAFLLGGGVPSDFTGLTAQQVEDYLAALQGAGLLASTFDGEVLTFFNDYLAFINGGGVPDQFGGLPDGLTNMFADLNGWQFAADALRVARADAEITDDGRITSMTLYNPNPVTTDYSTRDADLREFGRIGNDVAWTRYFVGVTNGPNSVPNVSEHLLVGTPATNLPTSGVVNYALVGGTQPTNRLGATGSTEFFDGEMAVAFGSTAFVGLNFDVLTATEGYRVGTTGGAADPTNGGIVVRSDGTFENLNLPFERLTATTCTGFCNAQVFGGLFGEGGETGGFTYNILDRGVGNGIQGVAIFQAGGTAIDGLGTAPEVPVPTGTPLLLNDATDFAGTTGVNFNFSSPSNVGNGFSLTTATFNDNDGVTAIDDSFQPRSIGTAQVTDISSNARFAIGRWTDGEYISANQFETTTLTPAQGFHYLLAAPTTGSFMVPTTGRIDYDLIAATAPTIADGSLAPGQFQADMAVLFGATNFIAMEGSITLPTAGDDYVYSFASTGGLTDPSQSDSEFRVTFGRNVNFQFADTQITTSDNSCDNTCVIQFGGYFAGDDINELGLTYTAQNGTFGQQISGAAIFGNGVYDDGSGDTGAGGALVNTYLGGFPDATGRAFATDGGNSQPGSESPTLDGSGALVSAGNLAAGTATAFNIAGDASAVVGRFSDGTATFRGGTSNFTINDGLPYVVLAPSVNALPTSGQIDYVVYAATDPVFNNGESAPGTFNGNLSVQFGSQLRYQTNGSIVMPEAGGDVTYAFASMGFDNGDFVNLNVAGPGPADFIMRGDVTGTGRGCDGSGCNITFYGGFGGENPEERAGFVYQIFPGSFSRPRIQGAVIYAPEGTMPGSGGGAATGLAAFTGTTDLIGTAFANGGQLDLFAGASTLDNGVLEIYPSQLRGSDADLSSGTGMLVENGGASDMVWARWQTPGQPRNGAFDDFHVFGGTQVSNLPASGRIDFEQIGSTKLVNNDGEEGTVSGDASLVFNGPASPRLGLELDLAIGGREYTAETSGGVADPSNSVLLVDTEGAFSGSLGASIVPSGTADCTSGCNVTVAGFVFGDGGKQVGLGVSLNEQGNFAEGSIFFDREAAGATGSATGFATGSVPGSAPTTTANTGTVAVAAPQSTDWDRWSVSDGASVNGAPDVATAPGVDALQSSGIQFSAEQVQMLEAHLAAQAR